MFFKVNTNLIRKNCMNRITFISFSRIERLGLVYIFDILIYTLVIHMRHTTVATLLELFVLVVWCFDVGFSFHERSTSFWQHINSYMSNARLVPSSTNDVQGRCVSARTIHRVFRNIYNHLVYVCILKPIFYSTTASYWHGLFPLPDLQKRMPLKVYFD